MIHALVLVCVAQAQAQAGAPTNPLARLDAHTVGKIMTRRPLTAFLAKSGLHPHLEPGVASPLAPLTATDFKLGSRLLTEQIASTKGLSPEASKQLVDTLNAVMDGFEKTQRKGNVAAALAWLLFNALDPFIHLIAHMSDEEGDGVVTAINDELAASSAFRKMSDLQKQQLYEACLAASAAIIGYEKTNDLDGAKKLGRSIIETYAP